MAMRGRSSHMITPARARTAGVRMACWGLATLVVADPQQAILTPAVRARAGVIMWEERPRIAIGGIILTHRCPLALRKVGTPAIPRLAVLVRFTQPILFYICHHFLSWLSEDDKRSTS